MKLRCRGGEPSTLNKGVLEEVIKLLRLEGEIKVKIVTNGYLFSYESGFVDNFDVIGLSINNGKEILEIKDRLPLDPLIKGKTIIITNFGNHNVFEFDGILNFIEENGFQCWQVQLNQGTNQLNSEGIKYLYTKLNPLLKPTDKLTVVIADNLQLQHDCTAGIMSCGISYKGEVVGCISEGAWNNGEFIKTYGIIGEEIKDPLYTKTIKASLKNIWEDGFKGIRFDGNRKSCRDCIQYPEFNEEKVLEQPPINIFYAVQTIPEKLPQFPSPQPNVFLYGVQPPNVVVYGAYPGKTVVYGVQWKATTTDNCLEPDDENL